MSLPKPFTAISQKPHEVLQHPFHTDHSSKGEHANGQIYDITTDSQTVAATEKQTVLEITRIILVTLFICLTPQTINVELTSGKCHIFVTKAPKKEKTAMSHLVRNYLEPVLTLSLTVIV
jgi:hypothetical protein